MGQQLKQLIITGSFVIFPEKLGLDIITYTLCIEEIWDGAWEQQMI